MVVRLKTTVNEVEVELDEYKSIIHTYKLVVVVNVEAKYPRPNATLGVWLNALEKVTLEVVVSNPLLLTVEEETVSTAVPVLQSLRLVKKLGLS